MPVYGKKGAVVEGIVNDDMYICKGVDADCWGRYSK